MDDDLTQFEAELKTLRPRAPSAALLQRIDRELAPAKTRPRFGSVIWLWATALPAAAALAIGLGTLMRRDFSTLPVDAATLASAQDAQQLKPVAVENVLYSARDEGLITLADGTPARRERLNYVDTITWKNPHTNASLKWSVPREEIRVVPVSFQ